jgi:alkylation response protein AidB-like acyl-CoA dehydrogenase
LFAEQLPTGWASDLWDDPVDDAAEIAFLRQWQRRLYEGGWTGLSWPKEFGGVGATLLEQAVFVEERDRAKAPLDVGIVGTQMVGPMLIKHGSPEQKGKYLRRILSGEDLWCQGFSEPSAGSDLAALSTRAEWRQDAWHINGQKVWTSRAQYADLMILLARSEAKSTSHQGITAFIVPMSTPGLAIRPLRQINGSTDFCEVFLDDVVLESESVVGEIGGGWKVAMSTLSFERFATTRAF